VEKKKITNRDPVPNSIRTESVSDGLDLRVKAGPADISNLDFRGVALHACADTAQHLDGPLVAVSEKRSFGLYLVYTVDDKVWLAGIICSANEGCQVGVL
jgi:hypothetical protein